MDKLTSAIGTTALGAAVAHGYLTYPYWRFS